MHAQLRKNRLAMVAGAAVALGLHSQFVSAAPITLLNWAPAPNSINPPFAEIVYNGANLQTCPGAQSNGDGNLPPANQTPGGLQVDTIANAPVPFSFPSSVFTGGTGYYDATLVFTGLAPIGAAVQAGGIDVQALGGGTFSLISTNVAPGPVLLLSGTINNANIVGADGGAAGAVIDAHGITYTGGAILAALTPGTFTTSGNDMSIEMTAVIPNFSINPGTLQLNSFTGDATGSFDINAVPEPASMSLLVLGAVTITARRRRGRRA
jgi:hypothetical protein